MMCYIHHFIGTTALLRIVSFRGINISYAEIAPVCLLERMFIIAITPNALDFILNSKNKYSLDFTITATLGRQYVFKSRTMEELAMQHISLSKERLAKIFEDDFCESLIMELGANIVDSFDYSDYQNSTYIIDLNNPIPKEYKNRYTFILDCGTIEHVFNIPVALRNVMDMLMQGGKAIFIIPANGYCGHGFWQFSPEVFYQVFSCENGFKTKAIAFSKISRDELINIKYLPYPDYEVYINNDSPTLLYVCVEKIAEVQKMVIPQQGEYKDVLWNKENQNNNEIDELDLSNYIMISKKELHESKVYLNQLQKGKNWLEVQYYNYKALYEELLAEHEQLRSVSDTKGIFNIFNRRK